MGAGRIFGRSVVKAVGIAAVAAVFCVGCGGGGGGGSNKPSSLVGQWEHASGATKGKPEAIELFKDGTGLVDGASITWKVENKRLAILSAMQGLSCNYTLSGYELALAYDDGASAIFVRKGKLEEFEAKQIAERAKRFKSYKYTGRTVKIGSQTWTAENINNEGGGKCYGNDPSNCAKYGRLFTWEEALVACPSGWHLPSDAEWTTLVNNVGGENIAGKKLKSKTGWTNNGNGTDEYGFSALPGGIGGSDGGFYTVGSGGLWWSATESAADYAWYRNMGYDGEYVLRLGNGKTSLLSVRCVQD